MKNLSIKIKLIFLPFLTVVFGTVLFYGIFIWLLDLQLGILPFRQDVKNIWIPGLLAIAATYFFFSKKLESLKSDTESNANFAFYGIILFTVVLSCLFVEEYLSKSHFKLVELVDFSTIKDLKEEKYFAVKEYEVLKEQAVIYKNSHKTGRRNRELNISFTAISPVRGTSVWIVYYRTKRVKNKSTATNKQVTRDFHRQVSKDFQNFNFQEVRFFSKIPHSENRNKYLDLIKQKKPHRKSQNQIFLWPHLEPFDQREIPNISRLLSILGGGCGLAFALVFFSKIDKFKYKESLKSR